MTGPVELAAEVAAVLILTEAAALALAGELVFLRRAPLASCPVNYFNFCLIHISPFGISGAVDRPQVTQGRRVRPEEVALIRDWLRDQPNTTATF
jgi:hypothetical protein